VQVEFGEAERTERSELGVANPESKAIRDRSSFAGCVVYKNNNIQPAKPV